MNKKFFSGMLVGVLTTLICAIVIVSVLVVSAGKKDLFDPDSSHEAAAQNQQQSAAQNTPTAAASNSESTASDNAEAAAAPALSKSELDAQFTERFSQMRTYVDNWYLNDYELEKSYDDMLHAYMNSLGDDYAVYYNEEEWASLLESTSGTYCGIGATVSQHYETRVMTIVKPFKGSPAATAGLLPGDVIVGVDGENVVGDDLNNVVAKMKGEAGTQVTVTVTREGVEKPIDFLITRAKIEVPTVDYKMREDGVGYIQVTEFDSVTTNQFLAAVNNLDSEGAKGLIIDLRDNPGGSLDVVLDMLDRMLPKNKLLVYTIEASGYRTDYKAENSKKYDKPVCIVINGNSASASEIFSGAMQDYGAATIVGTQSFGKGIVQSVVPIDGSKCGIKFTTSSYYTPKGVCIHGVGITPDVEVELDEELKTVIVEERTRDNQLDAAAEIILQKAQ